MSPWTLILIALSLAMDAFAISIASGIAIKNLRIRHALIIAAWFGAFQGVMPLLGWLGGLQLQSRLAGLEDWLAFGLLTGIGVKMIWESREIEAVEKERNPLDIYVLFVLSVATSLDALVAGFSFALLHTRILTPVLVIGGVTFLVCYVGVWFGDHIGHFFEKRIEAAAGLILIGIGVKILLSHLLAT